MGGKGWVVRSGRGRKRKNHPKCIQTPAIVTRRGHNQSRQPRSRPASSGSSFRSMQSNQCHVWVPFSPLVTLQAWQNAVRKSRLSFCNTVDRQCMSVAGCSVNKMEFHECDNLVGIPMSSHNLATFTAYVICTYIPHSAVWLVCLHYIKQHQDVPA